MRPMPPLIVLHLRPTLRAGGLLGLRQALRTLLRAYGLRCTRIEIALGDDAPLLDEPGEQRIARERGVATHDQGYGE